MSKTVKNPSLRMFYSYGKGKSVVLKLIMGQILEDKVILQLKGGTPSEVKKQTYDESRWFTLSKNDAKLIIAYLQSVFDI